MTIKDQLNADVKDAMRARDKEKLSVLRLITAAVKQVEVDERIDVDDARMLVILDKMSKQRLESIAQFKAAHRDDLVQQEEFELNLIRQYMPTPLSQDEINHFIATAFATTQVQSMADMGKIMAQLKPQMQGRADMAMVSALVKTQLTDALNQG